MLVKFYFPEKFEYDEHDVFLEKGWFRNCHMLFSSQLICCKDDVHSVVNIRVRLADYLIKKSMRKIWNKNQQFRVQVTRASLNKQKEKLYAQHCSRFDGYFFKSLEHFFAQNLDNAPFNTHEVCVYDQDKLIAFSFFDVSNHSISSLLGVFDQRYTPYSLGIYTMLFEIDYAKRQGKKYYYPGYIIDKPSRFDYKLRPGNIEYYDAKNNWIPTHTFPDTQGFIIHNFRKKIIVMERLLKNSGIPYKKQLYHFFSLAYLDYQSLDLVKAPQHFFLSPRKLSNGDLVMLLEYHTESDDYLLSWCTTIKTDGSMLDEMSESATQPLNKDIYSDVILYYEDELFRSKKPAKVIEYLLENFFFSE